MPPASVNAVSAAAADGRSVRRGQAHADPLVDRDRRPSGRRSPGRPTSSSRKARAERSWASARANSIWVKPLWASVRDEYCGLLPCASSTSSSSARRAMPRPTADDEHASSVKFGKRPARSRRPAGSPLAGWSGRPGRMRHRRSSRATPTLACPTCATCRGTRSSDREPAQSEVPSSHDAPPTIHSQCCVPLPHAHRPVTEKPSTPSRSTRLALPFGANTPPVTTTDRRRSPRRSRPGGTTTSTTSSTRSSSTIPLRRRRVPALRSPRSSCAGRPRARRTPPARTSASDRRRPAPSPSASAVGAAFAVIGVRFDHLGDLGDGVEQCRHRTTIDERRRRSSVSRRRRRRRSVRLSDSVGLIAQRDGRVPDVPQVVDRVVHQVPGERVDVKLAPSLRRPVRFH